MSSEAGHAVPNQQGARMTKKLMFFAKLLPLTLLPLMYSFSIFDAFNNFSKRELTKIKVSKF